MRISDWSSDVCSSDLAKGLPTTVADLRFAKPLDEKLIRKLLTTHEVAVTIEEGSIGGLGAHVLTLASDCGLIDAGLKLRTLRLPDIFQDQDKPEKQYADAGLDADRSEEHTSELQSLMRISYAVFCLKKKNKNHHVMIYSTSNAHIQ